MRWLRNLAIATAVMFVVNHLLGFPMAIWIPIAIAIFAIKFGVAAHKEQQREYRAAMERIGEWSRARYGIRRTPNVR